MFKLSTFTRYRYINILVVILLCCSYAAFCLLNIFEDCNDVVLYEFFQSTFNFNTKYGDKYRHRPYWYILLNDYLLPKENKFPEVFNLKLDNLSMQGYNSIIKELNQPGNLNAFGRLFAKRIISDTLNQRNCVNNEILIKDKEAAVNKQRGDIPPPVIVLGTPRSGTTFLHRLLSLDEKNFRAPRFHEYMDSCPRPAFDGKRTDEYNSLTSIVDFLRVKIQSFNMGAIRFLLPSLSEKHHTDATLPEEDVIPLSHVFASAMFATVFDVGPSYLHHLKQPKVIQHGVDYLKTYLERHLMESSSNLIPRRFLLKTPQHTHQISELSKAFPGCKIIWMHRDPVKTISSLISITFFFWGMGSDAVRNESFIHEKAREQVDFWSWSLKTGINNRRSKVQNDELVDINFKDFVKDPISQVKSIYSWLNLELEPKYLEKMIEFIQDWKTLGHSGKHLYKLEDIGLNETELQNEFAYYYDLFPFVLN